MEKTKIYIICGERSGDLHASNLVKSIKKKAPDTEFRGMGGELSASAGVDLYVDYSEVAVMGFLEVLFGFRKVLGYLSKVKEDIQTYRPDLIVLVDYGGFNMKIARFATDLGIPVHYYIPPKVWAWNQKRALKLKATTNRIYSILPFESEFFKRFDMEVEYVGNPLLDEIKTFTPHEFFFQKNDLNFDPIVALLPGSRKQEVNKMLNKMIEVSRQFQNIQFVIAGVSSLNSSIYDDAKEAGLKVVFDQTYDLLHHAIAAVVTSGTATLETAIFRVPQVVVYHTSPVSYAIGKRLIKVDYISLVNLIADKEVVKELIQDDFSVANLKAELNQILTNQVYKGLMLQGYDQVMDELGSKSASETVAERVIESLKK
ncbi:lipid-A-disaccharide synthase [Algoriphagus sediminis]|uniref:Lipid-A-disaccharide synthase n=1 Tax=Algoriphagus sediminis TaxID=3057113 RepID=A0ABT7YH64_9BACT|nr:lipid-A-disaccharide synthase [Algoriphagus sediminis]MDN3205813.1 lipid-A-disaccharide synthase [Algoriphagus sediminis]